MSKNSDLAGGVHEFLIGQMNPQNIKQEYLIGLNDFLKKNVPEANITKFRDKLDVAFRTLQERQEPGQRVIDLKQSFASSPKRKRTKDGGWYMVISIGLSYKRGRSAYSAKVWDYIVHGQNGTYTPKGVTPRQLLTY